MRRTGPSLLLLNAAGDLLGNATVAAVETVWKRCLSRDRFALNLERLEREGLIDQTLSAPNLDAVIRLTEKGREVAFGGKDLERRAGRPWDHLWRMAMFDIPESESTLRTRLRRRLRREGFGYLQHSGWVSPDAPEEIVRQMQGAQPDAEVLIIFEGRPRGRVTDAQIVQGAWSFGEINRRWENYLKVLRSRPRRYERAAWANWIKVEHRAWAHAIAADPMLPRELWPGDYLGYEALKQRMAFYAELVRRPP